MRRVDIRRSQQHGRQTLELNLTSIRRLISLLNYMREFMSQQWQVVLRAASESDVGSHGVRSRLDIFCGLGRGCIGMDADAREVMTEARLEELASGLVERLTGGVDDGVYTRRGAVRASRGREATNA